MAKVAASMVWSQHCLAMKSEVTFVKLCSDPCAEPKWKQKLAADDEHQEKTRQATALVLLGNPTQID